MAADHDPAPAATRSMRILDLLEEAQGAPLTLSAIASALQIAKSSTSNLLSVLEDSNMIQRIPKGYRLGRRTAELGGAFARQFHQIREFFDICDSSDLLRSEVVQITMRDGTDSLYLARSEGSRYGLGIPIGSRLPLPQCATGNALLSRLTDDEIRELVAPIAPFPQLTRGSVTTVDQLLSSIRQTRKRAYAIDPNGSIEGVTGVAVPIDAWQPGDPPLAIGAALRSEAASKAQIELIGKELIEAATKLTNPWTLR
ncbi:IclR family transcriptional regulator [Spelaeicoccus albus]|uniref:DNA-binding IclR family transcriptional regulator n=1 Tax=Spelaeicoccus albus TaxID=1280376 RepID=A0A7Z0D534_9MICO|nr:IclR family transcriptional regulator [Spelaeicoccus albus]NYI69047.1 DNA-binding IclR family transcriptional regulator [Spelaeicoccus albus]